jgi:hypothetical protein
MATRKKTTRKKLAPAMREPDAAMSCRPEYVAEVPKLRHIL